MGVVRLTSTQIPQFWDVIKFSLQQVERVGADMSDEKFNELFASLMSDKSQCFIKYNDEDQICAVMITEIIENVVTGERVLRLRSLYAFKMFENNEWQEGYELVRKLAASERCKKIRFESANNRLLELAKNLGFVKLFTTMEVAV